MDTKELAKAIRINSLKMVHDANASHIGGVLSMADILAVLYHDILTIDPLNPNWEDRDRFLLSKGHTCAGLYSCLALSGFFPVTALENYGKNGSELMTHVNYKIPGVEFSTGSLGHALPIGTGMALAAKHNKKKWRVFVLVSDGELDEGSNWESILFAPHHHLDNLIVVVDFNKIQSLGTVSDVLNLESLASKFRAFNWHTIEINGHDHDILLKTFTNIDSANLRPTVVIAHTIKGYGVNFMENKLLWHYRSPNDEQLQDAINQIYNS